MDDKDLVNAVALALDQSEEWVISTAANEVGIQFTYNEWFGGENLPWEVRNELRDAHLLYYGMDAWR